MSLFIERMVNGLADGAIYSLLALALVVIFRSTGQLNFAQGEIGTFGAFVVSTLTLSGWPVWISIGTAMVVGFAISAAEALPIIDALRAHADGQTRDEAYLGVGLADRSDGGQGAVVTNVEQGTPAAAVGIEDGDLIVAVDGAPTDGSTGLIAAIRDLEPGDTVTLTVMRDGDERMLEVTLTDRPDG